MKTALFLLFVINSSTALAQVTDTPSEMPPFIRKVETPNTWLIDPIVAYPPYDINKYLNDNVHYPDTAKEDGVQGRVWVQFVVNEDGSISDVKIKRGIGHGCDEEALRLIKGMPRWKPAMEEKKAVKITMMNSVWFKLE